MQYFVRYPEFRKKAVTVSFDDGTEYDIRVIDCLNKSGMKGTFFLNGGNFSGREIIHEDKVIGAAEAKNLYIPSGHEVGSHSLTHPYLALLPHGACSYEFMKDREVLESLFGQIIRGMAYPMNSYNDNVCQIARDCGYAYGRTVVSSYGFSQPEDWYKWEITCRFHDNKLFELCESFLELDSCWDSNIFYVFAHANEFEHNGTWNILETFCNRIGNRDDIWYATNIEICDYLKDASQIQSSADETMIYNPTARNIWLEKDDTKFVIKSGEILNIGK